MSAQQPLSDFLPGAALGFWTPSSQSSTLPRAVLFDLDDTLCDDASVWVTCSQNATRDVSAAHAAAGGLGLVERERLADVFLGISEAYWFSWDAVRETRSLREVRAAQWRQAMRESGEERRLAAGGAAEERLARLSEELADAYGACRSKEITLFPDVAPTLAILRERGICLALITNGLASTHVEKVEHLGLEAMVDHVVIAGVFGHFKPDRMIYDYALQLCGCAAHEALMVGDSWPNDVAGAQAAGIAAAWFNPSGVERPEKSIAPAAGELKAIGELTALLKIGAAPARLT